MSILATLAQQYFGAGNNVSSLQVGSMGAIGSQFDARIQALTGELGQWNPSAEGAIERSQQASAAETENVISQEWCRQTQRLARARLSAAQTIGNHQKAMAQISVQTARLQDQQVKGLFPLALQMGVTAASHQGRVSAIAQSRSRLFG
ncbi:hypothetical protein IFO70_10240 [Phormidium tenue FACHB-886]|nr:hypothetical protein [Phormidium tenue FACHB-886]